MSCSTEKEKLRVWLVSWRERKTELESKINLVSCCCSLFLWYYQTLWLCYSIVPKPLERMGILTCIIHSMADIRRTKEMILWIDKCKMSFVDQRRFHFPLLLFSSTSLVCVCKTFSRIWIGVLEPLVVSPRYSRTTESYLFKVNQDMVGAHFSPLNLRLLLELLTKSISQTYGKKKFQAKSTFQVLMI